MRPGARVAISPDGRPWRVYRVWVERPLPSWRSTGRILTGSEPGWLAPDGADESIVVWLALIVATVVVVLVLIPLLLFGIELILLGIAVALAILGRALLGRPWLVRAAPADDRDAAIGWRVVGWRRSGRVIEEVAAALAAGTEPRPAEPVQELLVARQRGTEDHV